MTVTPRLFSVLRGTGRSWVSSSASRTNRRAVPDAKIVITHASWTRRFGADPSIIGSTIEVDGAPRTVVGVIEPDFQYPPGNHEVEIYFPMALDNTVLPDREPSHVRCPGPSLDAGITTDAAAQFELNGDCRAHSPTSSRPPTTAGD